MLMLVMRNAATRLFLGTNLTKLAVQYTITQNTKLVCNSRVAIDSRNRYTLLSLSEFARKALSCTPQN